MSEVVRIPSVISLGKCIDSKILEARSACQSLLGTPTIIVEGQFVAISGEGQELPLPPYKYRVLGIQRGIFTIVFGDRILRAKLDRSYPWNVELQLPFMETQKFKKEKRNGKTKNRHASIVRGR